MIGLVLWHVLVLIGISNAVDDVACGTKTVFSARRVIGGVASAEGAWPWQALLLKHKYYQLYEVSPRRVYGGGSIITSKWILTAAHVFSDDSSQTSLRTKRWNRLLVILGLTKYPKLGDPLSDKAFVFEPADVIRHENYDSETFDYDIALIKFGRAMKVQGSRFIPDFKVNEIPFGGYIRPVCLPCMNSCNWGRTTFSASECKKHANSASPSTVALIPDVTVTGFGSTLARDPQTLSFEYPDNLQEAKLFIFNDKSCEEGMDRINEIYASLGHNVIANYTERMICASGGIRGNISDSCQGDSGGPLVKKVRSSDGSECWTQLGIVSWGLGCAAKPGGKSIPGYYVNVASLMEWVLEKIDRLKMPEVDSLTLCPAPTPPKNGFFRKNADERVIGTVIPTACNTGYRLKGKRTSQCLPSKEWEPFPTCQGSWDSWTPWSPCSATCRGKKERTRVCKASKCPGRNKQIRLCNTLGCLPMCSPIQPPSNGFIKVAPTPDVFSPETVVEYFCNTGWKLIDGPTVITCQSNQKWSDERIPVCEASIECPSVTPPANGSLKVEGTIVSFLCDDGWKLKGGPSSITCKSDKTWTTTRRPVCEEILCPAPNEIINGKVVGSERKLWSKVHFSCNVGYKLRGGSVSFCTKRRAWSGGQRHCERITCPTPKTPPNLVITGENYTSGSILRFSCKAGYTFSGPKFSTCGDNGKWSRFPRCKASTCPEPTPPKNGKVSKSKRSIGSKITFECNVGYVLDGESSAVCDDTGTWGPLPQCKLSIGRTAIFNPRECYQPIIPENGNIVRAKEKYSVGDYVEFACEKGFVLEGPRFSKCMGSDEFSDEIPRCSARTSCINGCTYIEQAPCQCHSFCFVQRNCCEDRFVFCTGFSLY